MRRWYLLAREKTKMIRMEEETISMTLEEDDKLNQNEINDKYLNKKYTMMKMMMKMKLLKRRRCLMKKKR